MVHVLVDVLPASYGCTWVVAGAGLDHGQLAELAEPLFGGVPAGKSEEQKSRYTGGDYRTPGTAEQSDALLAFEVSRPSRIVCACMYACRCDYTKLRHDFEFMAYP